MIRSRRENLAVASCKLGLFRPPKEKSDYVGCEREKQGVRSTTMFSLGRRNTSFDRTGRK